MNRPIDFDKRYHGIRYVDPETGHYEWFPAVFICNKGEDMGAIPAIISSRTEALTDTQMEMVELTDTNAIEILESFAKHVHTNRCIEGLPDE